MMPPTVSSLTVRDAVQLDLPAAGEQMYLLGSDCVVLLAAKGCAFGTDASQVLDEAARDGRGIEYGQTAATGDRATQVDDGIRHRVGRVPEHGPAAPVGDGGAAERHDALDVLGGWLEVGVGRPLDRHEDARRDEGRRQDGLRTPRRSRSFFSTASGARPRAVRRTTRW